MRWRGWEDCWSSHATLQCFYATILVLATLRLLLPVLRRCLHAMLSPPIVCSCFCALIVCVERVSASLSARARGYTVLPRVTPAGVSLLARIQFLSVLSGVVSPSARRVLRICACVPVRFPAARVASAPARVCGSKLLLQCVQMIWCACGGAVSVCPHAGHFPHGRSGSGGLMMWSAWRMLWSSCGA